MKTADVLNQLDRSALERVAPLFLKIGALCIEIRALPPLSTELRSYFDESVVPSGPAQITVEVLEGQTLTPAPNWIRWAREPGKSGRKDAYLDLEDGRLVFKERTGVTFLQSNSHVIAFGPVAANPNQVVNFINTQVLNHCLRDGWQICHAAAITNGPRTLAISGLSGGGKSTSILRLMDVEGTRFVSNDRLMVAPTGAPPQCMGIPKHPRINPGTILGNPRLHHMLSDEDHARLKAMPAADLWDMEEKYDLIIPEIYGEGRVEYFTTLSDFWVLNWHRNGSEPTRVTEVSLPDRPDLLAAIMKSPGPFYCNSAGRFRRDSDGLDPEGYLAALSGVRVSEVSGRVDFDTLATIGADLLG